MSEEIDTDFTGRFSFKCGIPFPQPDSFQKLNNFSRNLWYFYLIFPWLVAVFISCGSIYTLLISLSNLKTFAFMFIASLFLTSTTAKLLLFTIKYRDFTKVYNKMRLLSHEFSLRNDGYNEIYNQHMRPVMKFGKISAPLEFGTSCLYMIQLTIASFFNEKDDRRLPIEMKLPYDWRENPAYCITVWVQTLGGVLMIVRNTATDILLLTIMLVPAAQLKYLKKSLEKIMNGGEKNEEEFYWFAKSHRKVLGVVEGFKRLCVPYLCFAYGATMMDLFLTGVVITTPNLDWDKTKKVLVMGNILTHGIQLYILCFAADILTDSGLMTVSIGFSSELIFSPKAIRQAFSIAMARSLKPMYFTIAGLYPLRSSTFMDMIRLTATYFVTVVQIRDRFSRSHDEVAPET